MVVASLVYFRPERWQLVFLAPKEMRFSIVPVWQQASCTERERASQCSAELQAEPAVTHPVHALIRPDESGSRKQTAHTHYPSICVWVFGSMFIWSTPSPSSSFDRIARMFSIVFVLFFTTICCACHQWQPIIANINNVPAIFCAQTLPRQGFRKCVWVSICDSQLFTGPDCWRRLASERLSERVSASRNIQPVLSSHCNGSYCDFSRCNSNDYSFSHWQIRIEQKARDSFYISRF